MNLGSIITAFLTRHNFLKNKEVGFQKINLQYKKWQKIHQLTDEGIKKKIEQMITLQYKPRITLIISNLNDHLPYTLRSIQEQIYPQFELIILGNFSEKNITSINSMKNDKRVKLSGSIELEKAIKQAKGDFVGIIDSGDTLYKHALFEMVRVINESKADMLYSDEDKIDLSGDKIEPFFKPNWSPDLLLSVMYMGQLVLIRKNLINSTLLLKKSSAKTILWDMCLKASELTDKIVHIPDILYSQRLPEKSISGWPVLNHNEGLLREKVLKDTLKRRGIKGEVEQGPIKGSFRIKYKLIGEPLVTIIISTKDKAQLLSKCIDRILNNTSYQNFEILLIDNKSMEPETFKYFNKIKMNKKIRIIQYNKPFNIAAIYNWAVQLAKGDFLLFMGNDTEPISRDWLERMIGYGQREHVGAIGVKLLFPDNTIQHAGVVLGYGSQPNKSDHVAGHPFSRFPDSLGYFGAINLSRNYSAVTGACFLTRRSLYLEVGGFNEKVLKIRFNDVDYCLKLRRKGYFIVYAPECVLYHHESASVGEIKMDPNEIRYMRAKWAFWEDNDPFYNPNLTLSSCDYSLRV